MICYDDNRYTYRRQGTVYSIYDGADRIAEVCCDMDNRPAIAREMVRALNARDKYLKVKKQPKIFNRYE